MSDHFEKKENEKTNLPAKPDEEAANIYKAANSRVPFLKFRKGKYYIGAGEGEEVPLGTQNWAYCGEAGASGRTTKS
jgi:hypothetical protein